MPNVELLRQAYGHGVRRSPVILETNCHLPFLLPSSATASHFVDFVESRISATPGHDFAKHFPFTAIAASGPLVVRQ